MLLYFADGVSVSRYPRVSEVHSRLSDAFSIARNSGSELCGGSQRPGHVLVHRRVHLGPGHWNRAGASATEFLHR